MNDQTIVALAGIASATVLTPLITAFLARRMFRVQRAAERESAEFIDVRKRESDDLVEASHHHGLRDKRGRVLGRLSTLHPGT